MPFTYYDTTHQEEIAMPKGLHKTTIEQIRRIASDATADIDLRKAAIRGAFESRVNKYGKRKLPPERLAELQAAYDEVMRKLDAKR